MAADEFLAEEGARVATWLGGLLTRGLALPEGLSVDQRASQLDAARAAAAELAGAHWGHDSAGIEVRVQAAQFVSAHAAAMEWQAEANRRDLPPHARATAQRLARQLMALTTSQLNGLCRLKAEQRKEREQTMRLNEKTEAKAKAWSADRRALVADPEQGPKATSGPRVADLDAEAMAEPNLDEMAELALALAAPPPAGQAPHATRPSPRTAAEPQPVGAGVPEAPPEAAPLLNRRQRRALERLRRRERRRRGEKME